ncbi:hypothetical protein DL93DRAFT_383061 [Clavulina sp. PMI_390]|nr:hypothetical protein DL93DRAFT_383061 [Clavulina sp. PMI_390]
MFANVYEETLASDASPIRFAWPKDLLHRSSPLSRQERPSSSKLSRPRINVSKPSKLPAFTEVFEAAAEPPPPYTELPRVPFASCYALAYDRPYDGQDQASSSSAEEEEPEMTREEQLEALGQLALDLYLDDIETPPLSSIPPLSPFSSSSQPSSYSSPLLGPWQVPSERDSERLPRRQRNPAAQRDLAQLRMNFINKNVPQLAAGLSHFEERAQTPVADVFYAWYDNLAADQRVKYMPWFVPERLDLVKSEPTATATATAAPTSSSTSAPAPSKGAAQPVPSQSKAAAMAAAAHEAMKRKFEASRQAADPQSCTALPGWEELDVAVRLLRAMPQRKAKSDWRKEAMIRSTSDMVVDSGSFQWAQQFTLFSKWRECRLLKREKEWKEYPVTFADAYYSPLIFPTSWRRHPGSCIVKS